MNDVEASFFGLVLCNLRLYKLLPLGRSQHSHSEFCVVYQPCRVGRLIIYFSNLGSSDSADRLHARRSVELLS